MFALFYTFLYINDVKKRIHVLAKPQRSSLRIHLCASERSERAIFWVCNSITVKKVNFYTINVKFQVILSSKVGGGGIFVQRPSPHPKKWGDTSPIPPGFTPVTHSFAYSYRLVKKCFLKICETTKCHNFLFSTDFHQVFTVLFEIVYSFFWIKLNLFRISPLMRWYVSCILICILHT